MPFRTARGDDAPESLIESLELVNAAGVSVRASRTRQGWLIDSRALQDLTRLASGGSDECDHAVIGGFKACDPRIMLMPETGLTLQEHETAEAARRDHWPGGASSGEGVD